MVSNIFSIIFLILGFTAGQMSSSSSWWRFDSMSQIKAPAIIQNPIFKISVSTNNFMIVNGTNVWKNKHKKYPIGVFQLKGYL